MNNWILLDTAEREELLREEEWSPEESKYFAEKEWYALPKMVRKQVEAHFTEDQ